MAITYFPFQAGAGAPVLDTQWQQMMSLIMRDGVWANTLNTLAVTAGAGLQVLVNTGNSETNGIFMNNSASFAINLAAADPTNPRKDNIVVHADLVARTVTLIALTGTPNVSPVVPAITQNASVWEISIQNLTVLANAGTPSSLVDTRTYTPNWPLVYQQSGVGIKGQSGGQFQAGGAAQTWAVWAPFPTTCQVAPTSCTLVTIFNTNLSGQSAAQFATTGFLFAWSSTASGLMTALDSYTSVGNSILAVREGAFDFHCDAELRDSTRRKVIGVCDTVSTGRSLRSDLQVVDMLGSDPGNLILRHECPNCGAVECFNSALESSDESLHIPGWTQRMRDAAYIRQMQAQLKLPMLP